MQPNTTTTTEQFDHECAKRHAEDILKRGSAFSNPAKNLARCYLAKANASRRDAFERLDNANEVQQLRAEVALYRSLVNDLSCVITQLTYSEHNAP